MLDGGNGFVANGVDSFDFSGSTVGSAGDVNGDGLDDFMIGSPNADPDGRAGAGEVHVVFGTELGYPVDMALPASLELSALQGANGFVIRGAADGDIAGSALSGRPLVGQIPTGDVNGDGIGDLVIGAEFADPDGNSAAGEVYVVFGNAVPSASSNLVLLPPILEDETPVAGLPVEDSAGTVYQDVDPMGGLAVVGNVNAPADGRWQYSDDGIVWADVPAAPDEASALVLAATDRLRFVPQPDYFGGPGELLVRLWDGRWRQPGPSVDIRDAIGALGGFSTDQDLVSITIDVAPVNDAPGFFAVDPPPEPEDVGPVTVANWATFDPGAPNEAGQVALAYEVTSITNPELFRTEPMIDPAGNLVYETAPDAFGGSDFEVRVMDDGGGANGGIDISPFQPFTIDVLSVNDPPTFLAQDPPRVDPGAGPQTVPGWATFDPGAFNEAGQLPSYAVVGLDDPGFFDVPPSVDPTGTLTYTPAMGVNGATGFVIEVQDDGGTANGGQDTSPPFYFTVRVQDEVVFGDGFETPGP
jgi:hypothetical protein